MNPVCRCQATVDVALDRPSVRTAVEALTTTNVERDATASVRTVHRAADDAILGLTCRRIEAVIGTAVRDDGNDCDGNLRRRDGRHAHRTRAAVARQGWCLWFGQFRNEYFNIHSSFTFKCTLTETPVLVHDHRHLSSVIHDRRFVGNPPLRKFLYRAAFVVKAPPKR